jgi:hypothetical protein
MRIWDVLPHNLCRKHLIAEHGELHGLWSIITKNKQGYSRHPETLRWQGKLKALYNRHEMLVKEMEKRGFKHNSPLNKQLAKGIGIQDIYVDTPLKQEQILKSKPCDCFTNVGV